MVDQVEKNVQLVLTQKQVLYQIIDINSCTF